MLSITPELQAAWPGAQIGLLRLQGAENPPHSDNLEAAKAALLQELRDRFPDRAAIDAFAPVAVYGDFYRRFKKTYHVRLQLESVAVKGKAIPSVAALVEAMFMAELKNAILTAGHDLTTVQGSLMADVARGDEIFTRFGGGEQQLKAGDILLQDSAGVIGCVIYGPAQRTCINPDTKDALFVVYGPPGLATAAIEQHLSDIAAYARLIAPGVTTVWQKVYRAG